MLDKKDINRPFLLDLLSKHPDIKITFKKINGATRTIHCTLMESAVSANHQKSLMNVFAQRENLNIIPVWDIIEGTWKSFRIENILSVDDPSDESEKEKPKK